MGKLLTGKAKRKARSEVFQLPHSPFQKLIDGRRLELKWSLQQLAEEIGDKLNRGTLWIWIHTANGRPHRRSLTPARMRGLSRALSIPLEDLQGAYDASGRRFSEHESPTPPEVADAFRQFISILEHDRRKYINKETVLNLARRLYPEIKAKKA